MPPYMHDHCTRRRYSLYYRARNKATAPVPPSTCTIKGSQSSELCPQSSSIIPWLTSQGVLRTGKSVVCWARGVRAHRLIVRGRLSPHAYSSPCNSRASIDCPQRPCKESTTPFSKVCKARPPTLRALLGRDQGRKKERKTTAGMGRALREG